MAVGGNQQGFASHHRRLTDAHWQLSGPEGHPVKKATRAKAIAVAVRGYTGKTGGQEQGEKTTWGKPQLNNAPEARTVPRLQENLLQNSSAQSVVPLPPCKVDGSSQRFPCTPKGTYPK